MKNLNIGEKLIKLQIVNNLKTLIKIIQRKNTPFAIFISS